jgi:caffeoyl-CoA O-methyltransferase
MRRLSAMCVLRLLERRMADTIRRMETSLTDRIRATIERCQAFIADKDDALSLPEESARFVHATILAARPKVCVEIGTSYGHSGLWIASSAAAVGARVVTIDREARKSDIATQFFREAGLEGVITCRTGMAAEILPTIDGPIDWVLNDADKENYPRYVEMLYPRLSIGGMVLSDNVCNVDLVREQFVPWVRAHGGFFSTLVTVGNGLEMSVKIR